MHVLKFTVPGLAAASASAAREALQKLPGVARADINSLKGLARIIADRPIDIREAAAVLQPLGVGFLRRLPDRDEGRASITYHVGGTHCRSCEILIERSVRNVSGIASARVNAARGTLEVRWASGSTPDRNRLDAAVRDAAPDEKYRLVSAPERGGIWQILGMFVLVLVLGSAVSKLGFLRPNAAIGTNLTFAAVFLMGLIAASSSCIAVSGGVLLSALANVRSKFTTLLLFVGGRIAGYAIFGALIGALGTALSPSPAVIGALTIAAALYMLAAGLGMLGLAPMWLRRITPTLTPRFLGHRVLGANQNAGPALLGAGTFFLPCGFTQALQLYALTTGSAARSSLILFAFALGTAPSLLALGVASRSLRGAAGRLFYRFSGALVVVLGIWNIQNGFVITGHPLRFPSLSLRVPVVASDTRITDDPNVNFSGTDQSVTVDISYAGYAPAAFTLRRNVLTRITLSGPAAGEGCLASFQVPALGIKKLIPRGGTTIAFTPTKPGHYPFSCGMGMFRGEFTVL